MRIAYDVQADALTLAFGEAEVEMSRELAPDLIVNLDRGGKCRRPADPARHSEDRKAGATPDSHRPAGALESVDRLAATQRRRRGLRAGWPPGCQRRLRSRR